jgi:hypothetical protein
MPKKPKTNPDRITADAINKSIHRPKGNKPEHNGITILEHEKPAREIKSPVARTFYEGKALNITRPESKRI